MPSQRRAAFVHSDTNKPVKIYLHRTIDRDIRKQYQKRITKHGGELVDDPTKSEVVVISTKDNRNDWSVRFAASSDPRQRRIAVQFPRFLDSCIDSGEYKLLHIKPTGMGGTVRGGAARTNYTAADDEHLARYLAGIVPDPEGGGRRGNNIYIALVKLSQTDPVQYAWVNRHSWQSWRNRYNKNMDKIDPMIQAYIPIMNPKMQHNWSADRRQNKPGHLLAEEEEESTGDEADPNSTKRTETDDEDDDEDDDSQPRRPSRNDKGKGRALPSDDEQEGSDQGEGGGNGAGGSPPPVASDGEEGQRDNDEDEWQPPQGFDGPSGNVATLNPTPQRRARFAAATSSMPKDFNISKELARQPSSSPYRRRPGTEERVSKRPRLSGGSDLGPQKPMPMKSARRPKGWRPGMETDTGSDDEGDSDGDSDAVAHSLFSASDEDEEAKTTLVENLDNNGPSATSSSVFPISNDSRTLVASASPRKLSVRTGRLSSASGKSVDYIDLTTKANQSSARKPMEVIVVEDDDDDDEDGGDSDVEIVDSDEGGVIMIEDEGAPGPESPRLATPPPEEPTNKPSRSQRRKPSQPEPQPAPTRVTRSRSRSVEPQVFVSLPLKSNSKRKGKQKAVEPDPIPEEEEVESQGATKETLSAHPETLADEEDVMQLVTNEDDFSGISNVTSAARSESVSETSGKQQRDVSPQPSSDDEQTMDRIAASQRQQQQQQQTQDRKRTATIEPRVITKRPRQSDAILQAFNANRNALKQAPPRASLPGPSTGALAGSRRVPVIPPRDRSASAQQQSAHRRAEKPWKPAYDTPTPASNVARKSGTMGRDVSDGPSSSDETAESYPAPGTKAKAYVAQLVEEEKHTPYTPPKGTRAALHAQRARQAASRSARRGDEDA